MEKALLNFWEILKLANEKHNQLVDLYKTRGIVRMACSGIIILSGLVFLAYALNANLLFRALLIILMPVFFLAVSLMIYAEERQE